MQPVSPHFAGKTPPLPRPVKLAGHIWNETYGGKVLKIIWTGPASIKVAINSDIQHAPPTLFLTRSHIRYRIQLPPFQVSFQTLKEVPVGLPESSLNKNNAVEKGWFTVTVAHKAILAYNRG